jgi:hypothetical protein
MKTLAFLLMAVCAIHFANAQVTMEPEDKPVTLTGTIRLLQGYGPPGWGENKKTDPKFTYLVIELSNPINTPCTPSRPEWRSVECGSAKQLELFFRSSATHGLEASAKKLIGQRATVEGTLQRAIAPAEMTPIYVEVTALQAAKLGINTKLP